MRNPATHSASRAFAHVDIPSQRTTLNRVVEGSIPSLGGDPHFFWFHHHGIFRPVPSLRVSRFGKTEKTKVYTFCKIINGCTHSRSRPRWPAAANGADSGGRPISYLRLPKKTPLTRSSEQQPHVRDSSPHLPCFLPVVVAVLPLDSVEQSKRWAIGPIQR